MTVEEAYEEGYRAGLWRALVEVDKGGRCEQQIRAVIAEYDDETSA